MDVNMKSRRPRQVVAVLGSGSGEARGQLAYETGSIAADLGCVLVTGGGGGIMAAASQGAAESGGLVVGILPSARDSDPRYGKDFPNPWVEIAVYTGFGEGRNVINVRSASVVVAFRGGSGTISEIALAVKAGKPVVVVDWPEVVALFRDDGGEIREAGSVAEIREALTSLVGRH